MRLKRNFQLGPTLLANSNFDSKVQDYAEFENSGTIEVDFERDIELGVIPSKSTIEDFEDPSITNLVIG